jgi:hypothetical protein
MSQQTYADVDEADLDPVTGLVRDGGKVRVRMIMMDAALPTGTTRRAARAAASSAPTDDIALATLAALATRDTMDRMTIAAASYRPGFRCHTADAGIDLYAGERARQQRITEDSNAWRDAPDTQAWGTKAQVLPLGAWKKTDQQEGTSCFVDGCEGRWRDDGGDGLLRCRPEPMPSARSGTSSGDAQLGTREFVDATWRAMVEEQANAWKS